MEPTSPGRRLLWWLTRIKGQPQRWLARLCRAYIHAYNDFSYDPRVNGEESLLYRLKRVEVLTIFDVGANVGDWSLMASQVFPSSSIHAFELSNDTREVLRARAKGRNIQVVDAALGDQDGEVAFKDFGNCSGLNTVVVETTFHDWREPALRSAKLVRGESYCLSAGLKRIDFLKIDVEGYEGAVLEGFGGLLNPNNVRCIQFEYGYANGDAGWLMRDFSTFFADRGYVVGKLWHDGVDFVPFDYSWNNFESGPNWVAVGREDGVLQRMLARQK